MNGRHMETSRSFAVSVEHAYDTVLTTPLTEIFNRRYLVIAPIERVDDQDVPWGAAVGQSRSIRFTDRGTVLETLTALDRPRRFGYSISDITGPMKPVVAAVSGSWAFDPAGAGVTITWAWDVTPTARLGRLAMPVFAKVWSGYARQAMDQIDKILVS